MNMMRMIKKVIFLCLLVLFTFSTAPANAQISKSQLPLDKMERWIEEQMDKAGIPGLSVVISGKDSTLYQKGFGYAGLNNKRPVTGRTLFELGSTSKAFTGLAVLQLQDQGIIRLSDPVSAYLPWFKMHFKGEHQGEKIDGDVDITLEQLLHHTSGIPFETIKDIPQGDGDDSLQRTVKNLVNRELDFYPGEQFQYATINYDVLGLVIEEVTGSSFETYVRTHVLDTLGLKETFLFRQETAGRDMADGYKHGFMQSLTYNAPMYRGDTPAGYFITNANDMSKWLQIQLGSGDGGINRLIGQSHSPDRTVPPAEDGSSYAAGWSVYQLGSGMLSHSGSNPNYSSQLVLLPGEEIGIAVLANLNSDYTEVIGNGIAAILQGKAPEPLESDMFQDMDRLATAIFIVSVILGLTFAFLLGMALMDFAKRQRTLSSFTRKHIAHVIVTIALLSFIAYCLTCIPEVLFMGLSWDFMQVWAPFSLLPAVFSVAGAVFLFAFYMFIVYVFPKKKEKALIPLFILSFISGFGNAIVIFSVVEALKKVDQVNLGLLLYYGLGILFYVAGQKLIRNKMIELTHNLVYEKRSKLIQNLLHTPFYKFEKIDRGEIYAVLKGDTELVSHLPSIAVSAMTNLVTVLFCLVYLSIVNFGGLLVSVSILVLASVIYFLMARSADTLWEQSRDIQNHFFSYINDLVQGFKELSLSRRRRYDFSSDLDNSNLNFRAKNIKAGYKFTNAFVVGELLFVLVIGGIAFVFPVLFTNIQSVTLSTFVFVFLYMTGPINALLDVIPELVQIRISWNRLNQLIQNTSQHKVDQISHPHQTIVEYSKKFTLENVEYEYDNGEESFRIGPISYEFRIGEITFITGGNGSGKTTFAKLLTGLYKAKNGTILLDGQELDHSEIGEYFSNVFSDFYLFKRIYGIETAGKEEQINTYLELLQMQEKVDIVDGKFSTIDLSTGQRKRLALLISYLEDKPFCLFDEWAADQDPEFRKFFYEDLLPELKRRGKCVIAITHDDRYFYLADKIIKMNAGEVEYIEGLTGISS